MNHRSHSNLPRKKRRHRELSTWKIGFSFPRLERNWGFRRRTWHFFILVSSPKMKALWFQQSPSYHNVCTFHVFNGIRIYVVFMWTWEDCIPKPRAKEAMRPKIKRLTIRFVGGLSVDVISVGSLLFNDVVSIIVNAHTQYNWWPCGELNVDTCKMLLKS